MHRCLQLAVLGAGNVAPNPMVGAVLVHDGRIIGEGYHMEYGQAHAEVNCINSVAAEDEHLIAKATIYVSLEPCAHYGKTPPCADFIIQKKIPNVVIACRDSYKEVSGKGISKLQAAGINVTLGILEDEALALNERFFTFHEKQRPYIILKWAQTADGIMASSTNERLLISNAYSNRLVHKWRTEEAAILVGKTTALKDDPALTARLWEGHNPVRVVIDRNVTLPQNLQLFDGRHTIVFNTKFEEEQFNIHFYKLNNVPDLLPQVMHILHSLSIQSVLIEGGKQILESCISTGLWDEARVIINRSLIAGDGLKAPSITGKKMYNKEQYLSDEIWFYQNK